MATVFDPNKDASQASNPTDPNKPDSSGAGVTQPAVVGGSGASSSIDASGGGTNPASSQAQPVDNSSNSSGRFVNIQNYVNANKPSAPDQSIASKIGQNIDQVKQQDQQQLDQSQQNFNQSANANHVQYDQGVVDKAVQDPTAFLQQGTQGAAPSQDMTAFQNMRSGQYQGPRDIDNYGQLQQNTQNLQDLTKQTASEGGRFNLLKTFFGNPNYTQGQQTLDNLLVQSDPAQMEQLQGNRAQAAELARNLQSTQENAQRTAQQYSQDAAQARTQLGGALNSAVTGFGSSLDQKAQAAQAARDAAAQHYNDYLSKGYLDQDMMSKLGLSAGQNLYNVDPTQFLHESALKANAQNVAGSQDYARLQALNQLGGDTLNTDASKLISSFGDPSQAGAFDKDPGLNFDKQNFQDAVTSAQNQYNTQANALNPIRDQATSALTGNLYVNGGINNAISSWANQLRNDPNSAYGQASQLNSMGIVDPNGPSADALKNMSDDDVIQKYGYNGMAQAGSHLNLPFTAANGQDAVLHYLQNDPAELGKWLVNQRNAEQQKLNSYQNQFQQIQNLFGANRTLQMAPDPNSPDARNAGPDPTQAPVIR